MSLKEQLRTVIEQRNAMEVERDLWEARAVALFWSGSVDDATCAEIRKATEQYQEWKAAKRAAVNGEAEHG